ncbi:MAG: hypothetical protein PHN77_21915 [Thermoguttaceae bacterium]|nr:hypothetical protein [Thermoguttaceae bacterium]
MPTINSDIHTREVFQNVLWRSSVTNQPASELLRGFQIMVAGLRAASLTFEVTEERLHVAGFDVLDRLPFALLRDLLDLRSCRVDLLLGNTLVDQVSLERINVRAEWAREVVFVWVETAGPFELDTANQVIEHRLRSGLVVGQRDAAVSPQHISIAAPPLPRFLLDLLARLRVGYHDRLLV